MRYTELSVLTLVLHLVAAATSSTTPIEPYMNILCILSTVAFLLPVMLITWFRLYKYPSYLSILLYCSILVAGNLDLLDVIHVKESSPLYRGALYNFFYGPLILLNLHCLATDRLLRKSIEWLAASAVMLGALIFATQGFSLTTSLLCMGPCLLIGFMLSAYFAWFHIKTALKRLLVGKAMIAGSFLFLYGSYVILFVMHYILEGKEEYIGVFFLTTSFLAMLFMTAGLYFERMRVRKLKEMKVTRNELIKIYDGQPVKSKAASLEAALAPTEYQL